MSEDMVLVNRKEIRALIEEIGDRLDELELLTEPEFAEEVEKRVKDINEGIQGLNEDQIAKLLK